MATLVLISLVVGCGTEPDPTPDTVTAWTRGPVPDSAIRPDGSIDLAQVPDFVPAARGDGIAGWVAASGLFPAEGAEPAASPRVHGNDLVTVVGHMYPSVGFVPLGSEAEMLPDPSRNRSLRIVVRNDSDSDAVLEMTEARDEARWRAILLGPPTVIRPGEERAVLFESPLDRWSLPVRMTVANDTEPITLNNASPGRLLISPRLLNIEKIGTISTSVGMTNGAKTRTKRRARRGGRSRVRA
jgi:hypothetical protein